MGDDLLYRLAGLNRGLQQAAQHRSDLLDQAALLAQYQGARNDARQFQNMAAANNPYAGYLQAGLLNARNSNLPTPEQRARNLRKAEREADRDFEAFKVRSVDWSRALQRARFAGASPLFFYLAFWFFSLKTP